MSHQPPHLHVLTQAGPSTHTTPRRPQGGRRRPGLFVANPDDSDEEPSSRGQASPTSSPVAASSTSGNSGGASKNIPIVPPQPASPRSHLPSIPAPQSSPLPSIPSFSHDPSPSSPPQPLPVVSPVPPQPPPQPERHMQRRAFTTPVEQLPRVGPGEHRASAGNIHNPSFMAPPSPSARALPALPSPPLRQSPQTTLSPSTSTHGTSAAPTPAHANPLTPGSIHSNSDASSVRSYQQYLSHTTGRVESPEAALSPANTSDGGRSVLSLANGELVNRTRSGSVQTHKKHLQVTLDNEQFTLVDISGLAEANEIKERIFAKLRFTDDDFPTLGLYRTDFGEEADETPCTSDELAHLCSTLADSKATLKFLVKHTRVPDSSSATVVPPLRRPQITTDLSSHLGAPQRTPSRHSKDGSLSASDWSEIAPEEAELSNASGSSTQLHRSKRSVRYPGRGRLTSSAGSSRSPLTDPSASMSSLILPTPPSQTVPMPVIRTGSAVSSPTRYVANDIPGPSKSPDRPRHGNSTPTPAGPSNHAGLGLENLADDMDPETRALIEQFQKEEEEALRNAEERQRQLAADEEIARIQQQEERDVWQEMQRIQAEERRRQEAQIQQDELRAREVEAEERRLEQQRVEQEARSAQWERDWDASGGGSNRARDMLEERRSRADFFERQESLDVRAVPGRSFNARRPSNELEASRQHQYPATNPLFDRPIYTSPPAAFGEQVPTAGYPRQPSGFPASPFEEATHARDRRDDPRLQEFGRSRPHAAQTYASESLPARRQNSRGGAPWQRGRPDAASLKDVRSMEHLRPFTAGALVSRPPYQGIPPRSAMTPQPGSGAERLGTYRSPSMDRAQDGRYPEPSASAPSRAPPLQIQTPAGASLGIIPFPNPSPHASSGTWTDYPQPPRRPSYDRPPPSPRPHTFHDALGSPRTADPRMSSFFENAPESSHTYSGEASRYATSPNFEGRSRSGSASAVYPGYALPAAEERRRASESSAGDGETQLPYANRDISPEHTWLSVPSRRDTDTASVAGTVSSDATVRPRRGDDEDSAETARAADLQKYWEQVMGGEGSGGTYRAPPPESADDEATIFIGLPQSSSPKPNLSRTPAMRPSPSKPNLYVDTAQIAPDQTLTPTPSDSATESESETTRVRRARSFARPRDQPEQWAARPDPERIYEQLDNYFPKIDLDRPIVEGGSTASTPTTPASESPVRLEPSASFQPPPLHPTRQSAPPPSPKHEDLPKGPPPQHPARGQFNKAENRKSIRVMADHKRRTLFRDLRDAAPRNVFAVRQEEKKPERRKSSSMWGHRVVEVTPSKLASTGVSTIPESPSTDGKPQTLNWVKGELIGKGSYGRVYIALNVTTGDMMAVKQVELPNTERDRNDRRQMGQIDALRSEIALLKDLYHTNIVQYLGCETSPSHLSIFLEYVPGGTIASIYRTPNQARFEEQLVKFFTAQILEGLAYLHAKHIWHRDLKGDNILVDAAGVCKISDFGISKQTADAYDSFGQATNMKGSVFWMAPEVIHSDPERSYSGKVDIWSLGCVVLEMWTGKRPWGEMEQVAAMMQLFQRARPPLPPDIHLSETALDFMNNLCLARDPHDRPMAYELLEHPFITQYDPNWTFASSKIGKAVAKRGVKGLKAGK